jgi:hypothetical protein
MPELELEQELRALGARIEIPPAPDVAGAVRARITAEPRRVLWPTRRALAIALTGLVAALGAVMAVPQARTAILDWLGLRGVEIERVPERPKARPPGADLALGRRATLAEAREAVDFRLHVPSDPTLAEPDAVYYSTTHVSGGYVAFVYGSGRDVRLLITQFRARIEEDFVQKAAGPGTRIEAVTVDGGRGFWLEGEPHEFVFLAPDGEPIFETLRLATNTLLWESGAVTLRIEGDVTKEEALRIARSMR